MLIYSVKTLDQLQQHQMLHSYHHQDQLLINHIKSNFHQVLFLINKFFNFSSKILIFKYYLESNRIPSRRAELFTDEDLNTIKEMFPTYDIEVIKSLMESNGGNKEATIESLLQMLSD